MKTYAPLFAIDHDGAHYYEGHIGAGAASSEEVGAAPVSPTACKSSVTSSINPTHS